MTGRHSCRVRCAGAVTTAPRCACESMPPYIRFPSAPAPALPHPAGHPGYRSRPRAHAASTFPPLPGGRGIRRCSGTGPGPSRIGGQGIRPAVLLRFFIRLRKLPIFLDNEYLEKLELSDGTNLMRRPLHPVQDIFPVRSIGRSTMLFHNP